MKMVKKYLSLKKILYVFVTFLIVFSVPSIAVNSASSRYTGQEIYAALITSTGKFASHLTPKIKRDLFLEIAPHSLKYRKKYQGELNTYVKKNHPSFFGNLKKAFYSKDYMTAEQLIRYGYKINHKYFLDKASLRKNITKREYSTIAGTSFVKGKIYTKADAVTIYGVAVATLVFAGVLFVLVAAAAPASNPGDPDSLSTQMSTRQLIDSAN